VDGWSDVQQAVVVLTHFYHGVDCGSQSYRREARHALAPRAAKHHGLVVAPEGLVYIHGYAEASRGGDSSENVVRKVANDAISLGHTPAFTYALHDGLDVLVVASVFLPDELDAGVDL
jgi:hypothetical protein